MLQAMCASELLVAAVAGLLEIAEFEEISRGTLANVVPRSIDGGNQVSLLGVVQRVSS